MPEHTLAERLKNKAIARTAAIAALDAAEQGTRKKPAAKKPAAKKPVEKKGTGRSSFDLEGAISKIQRKIDATSDSELKAKLKARQKALRANAE